MFLLLWCYLIRELALQRGGNLSRYSGQFEIESATAKA